MALVIRRERIISLYEALGFKTADNWDDERLIKKIESLEELTEGVKIKDAKIRKLLDKVLKAGKIKIKTDKVEGATETNMGKKKKKKSSKKEKKDQKATTEQVEETTKKKKKSGKKAKIEKKVDKKKSSKKDSKKKSKKDTKKTTTDKKKSEKKMGVIDTVIDCLKKEHTTVKNIVKVLVKKFPDRNPESMENTTNRCIKSYLRTEKNIVVDQDSKGKFFIK